LAGLGFIAQLQLSEAYSLPKAENWGRYVSPKRSFGIVVLARQMLQGMVMNINGIFMLTF
jgi:hypothetical protein